MPPPQPGMGRARSTAYCPAISRFWEMPFPERHPHWRASDAVLPWDIIDGGMKSDFFRAEMDKAMRAEWTLPARRQRENPNLLNVLP